ncbi:3'-5' exonuclease [Bosea vestrisii]|uniref:3'-5' exonuclease n=1 Tax=Bosea vestrisii TaxID=151416 RepID=A0ABW0HA42_9HYPH
MTRLPDTLLVLDVETVVDRTSLPGGRARGDYLKPIHHEVVAISIVRARIERAGRSQAFIVEECRSGGEEGFDEGRLLAGFWRFFAELKPRLVTWHGRQHDMPILSLRAMMRGLDVSTWTEKDQGRDYRFRYDSAWHCDLADQMADYGSTLRLTLDEAATAFGLPGKVVDGPGDVETLHREGRIAGIRSYCECDVLNLFGVFLHWAHSTGASTAADRDRGLAALRALLERDRASRRHFGAFADRWRPRRASGRPLRSATGRRRPGDPSFPARRAGRL